MLFFGLGNKKVGRFVATFSLPAGYSCPGAKDCLSRANRETGKITDGPNIKFRCFSASAEAVYPNVRDSRWRNFELLRGKTKAEMSKLISNSLPFGVLKIRCHVAGDFFSQDYFDAWLDVAKKHSTVLFYAYTKSLNFWLKRKNELPENFRLVASRGGKWDSLIDKNNLVFAQVVRDKNEADILGMEVDTNDEHAQYPGRPFALIVHGNGPKGTWQSKQHYKQTKL